MMYEGFTRSDYERTHADMCVREACGHRIRPMIILANRGMVRWMEAMGTAVARGPRLID